MPRPFTQTIRSMEKDHPKTVIVILLIATLILAVWNIWFFFAQISLFESSIHAEVTEKPEKIIPGFSGPGRAKHHKQHIVMASFPLEMRKKIFQGQKGVFFPASNVGSLSEGIMAVVLDETIYAADKKIQVQLKTIEPLNSSIMLQPKTNGLIKLEIKQVSPFELLLMKLKEPAKNKLSFSTSNFRPYLHGLKFRLIDVLASK